MWHIELNVYCTDLQAVLYPVHECHSTPKLNIAASLHVPCWTLRNSILLCVLERHALRMGPGRPRVFVQDCPTGPHSPQLGRGGTPPMAGGIHCDTRKSCLPASCLPVYRPAHRKTAKRARRAPLCIKGLGRFPSFKVPCGGANTSGVEVHGGPRRSSWTLVAGGLIAWRAMSGVPCVLYLPVW